MSRFLSMSHSKGMNNARSLHEDSPTVSNMIPEEKMREKDLVGKQTHPISIV